MKWYLNTILIFFIINIMNAGENINLVKSQLLKQQVSNNPQVINRRVLDINRISAFFSNDGEFYSNHSTIGPGFEWPKGSNLYAIFSAGLWIGAKVQLGSLSEIRVATVGHFGSEYRPGRILEGGQTEDPTLPHLRIYQVYPKIDLPTSNPDYLNWPIDQGAPWIDIDNDGIWNPYVDKIGINWPDGPEYPDAIQFYVYNDNDPQYHTWIWGRSKPLGVEIQQTNWAYKLGFGDMHFIRFRIFNKSNNTLDSTYFGLWCDADIGNAFDDCLDFDTTLDINGLPHNLGIVYNNDNNDDPGGYGTAPPAVGFKLMQGPLVPGNFTDTAIAFGKKYPGYINSPISSINFFCNPGQTGCTNPEYFDPNGAIETYNYLKGLTRYGNLYYDEYGRPTKFIRSCVSGFFPPYNMVSDLRFLMPTGPLTIAPGDSQEVIYSIFIARGTDHLNSVEKVKNLSELINLAYKYNFKLTPNVTIKHIQPHRPPFIINAKIENAIEVHAKFLKQDRTVLDSTQLFDDGLHEDQLPGDNIWGNILNPQPDSIAGLVTLTVKYSDGKTLVWPNILINITSIGQIKIDSFIVVSDNINKDYKPNPGENIRFKIRLSNNTDITCRDLRVNLTSTLSPYIRIIQKPAILLNQIEKSQSIIYPEADYYTLDISPLAPANHEVKLIFEAFDVLENLWHDTLSFKIEQYAYSIIDTIPHHITGDADGNFGISLINHSQLKDNYYNIEIVKNTDTKLNLINTTILDTILREHELPDSLGHNMPVTDGFKINIGTVTTKTGIKSANYIPATNKWFSPAIYTSHTGVMYPTTSNFISKNSKILIDELKIVEIRFSNNTTQKAYRYLSGFAPFPPYLRLVKHPEFRPFVIDSSGSGFIYQDYEMFPLGNPLYGRTVPFTVWEIDKKTGAERQLNIAIIEKNDTLYKYIDTTYVYVGKGNIDGKWWPTTHSTGGSEILVIFASTYSEFADTFYTNKNLYRDFNQLDVYYVFWPRIFSSTATFEEGDILRITPYFPLKQNDVFTFNPLKLLNVQTSQNPESYILHNNYPNPFNTSTTIKYEIPLTGKVTIEIFNILGQKIYTLVDEILEPGIYTSQWDGKNNYNVPVSSGLYLYRLKSNNTIITKKMILLK